jgi:hypothetical protein
MRSRSTAAVALLLCACGDELPPSTSSPDGGGGGATVPPGVSDAGALGEGDDARADAIGASHEADAAPPDDASDASFVADAPVADAPGLDSLAPVDSGGGAGHVVFLLPDGHWHRVAATPGASVEDLDTELALVSPGDDAFANLSPDGAWIALDTRRFGCASSECLAIASGDVSRVELVPGAQVVARPAVAPGGAAIVYPSSGGPHAVDLYAVRRTANGWSAPLLLTASSPAPEQHDVAFAWDGSRVAFDCGPTPYQNAATSICEVGLDGAGLRVVVSPADGPNGSAQNETHHPGYAPDGTIVFEADWSGSEAVWRIGPQAGPPVKVSPSDVTDDNSPCVLPDGRIASLWLGRPGNTTSKHELKVMNADGSGQQMIVTGVDIVDVGVSCGR